MFSHMFVFSFQIFKERWTEFTLVTVCWGNAMNTSFVTFKDENVTNFLPALIAFYSPM